MRAGRKGGVSCVNLNEAEMEKGVKVETKVQVEAEVEPWLEAEANVVGEVQLGGFRWR